MFGEGGGLGGPLEDAKGPVASLRTAPLSHPSILTNPWQGSGHRELVTPPLHGTILPGVTRDSILALARAMPGVEVSERTISIGEVERAAAAGRLLEAFGCGTACIVQPISSFVRAGGQLMRAAGDGAFVARMHAALCDIQYGRVSHPWSVPI